MSDVKLGLSNATTSRSSCKVCKETIEKDTMRVVKSIGLKPEPYPGSTLLLSLMPALMVDQRLRPGGDSPFLGGTMA